MSNLVDKEKLMEWLWEQYIDEGISMDRARAYQQTRDKIEKGEFDTEQEYIKLEEETWKGQFVTGTTPGKSKQ